MNPITKLKKYAQQSWGNKHLGGKDHRIAEKKIRRWFKRDLRDSN